MSTANEARVDIYNRFNTLWANATPVTFDNEKFNPPANEAPWARLSIRNISAAQETLGKVGNRKYERKGLISIQIFTKTNSGVSAADTFSEAAKNIFEGTSFNNVIANNAVIKEIGVSDGYYQHLVQIDFFYTETK